MQKRYPKHFLLVPIVLVCLVIGVGAITSAQSRYIDDVGLLTASEGQDLRRRLDQISEAHSFDVVIAVVGALPYGPAHLYAADLFEKLGFGYGDGRDGAILLLAMQERDLGFAALGSGITTFTPQGQEYLDTLFLPDLQSDRYFQGFLAFVDGVDDFLTMAEAGTPYLSGYIPLAASERRSYQMTAIGASLFVALIAAFITAQIARGQLKSVRQQQYAQGYIRQGSLHVEISRDLFLYRNLRREERQETSKKSGGSFKTSSGRSATGHSKKF